MKSGTKIIVGIMALIGLIVGFFFIASAVRGSLARRSVELTAAPTYNYPTAAESSPTVTPLLVIPGETQTPAAALTATINDVSGSVQARQPAGGVFSPAANGTILQVGGQVQTGADGRARLDLSSGTIVRVSPSTIFTLVDNQPAGETDLVTRLQLDLGQLFVILSGGTLDVETASGVASVRGSYLMVEVPSTGGVRITCLEGTCELAGLGGSATLTNGQSAVITNVGSPPVVGRMTEEDVREWLMINPEATVVIPYLVVSATPTITPTPTRTRTPAPAAIRTNTPVPTNTQAAAPTAVPHCNNVLIPIRTGQGWLYEFQARGTSHLIDMSVLSVSGRQGVVNMRDSVTGLSSQATVTCESGEIRAFPLLNFTRLLDPTSTVNMTYSSGVLAPSLAGFETYNWWMSWRGVYTASGTSKVAWQGVDYAVSFNNAPVLMDCQTTAAGSAAFQTISVPAGTFTNALAVVCAYGMNATVTVDKNTVQGTVISVVSHWFAPNIGLLRSQVEETYIDVLGLTFPLDAGSSIELLEYRSVP